MKRLICIIAMVAIGFTATYAQKSFSTGQKKIRDEIYSFLKNEGFQPSIDDDGDIKFKRQGDVYFVCVSDKDSSPYYVRLSKYYSYDGERLTRSKIGAYAEEVNKYKMCKLIVEDDSFIIDSQLFLYNSSAFTSIFNKIMEVIDGAEEELM